MLPYTGECFGNPSSIHIYGRACKAAVDKARERLASLLDCKTDEIVFVASGSEADNHAILAAVRRWNQGATRSSRGRQMYTWHVSHFVDALHRGARVVLDRKVLGSWSVTGSRFAWRELVSLKRGHLPPNSTPKSISSSPSLLSKTIIAFPFALIVICWLARSILPLRFVPCAGPCCRSVTLQLAPFAPSLRSGGGNSSAATRPHVVSSLIEHPAVTKCLNRLAGEGKVDVTYVGVSDQGRVSVEDVKAALLPTTVLVTIMHSNNEVGMVFPRGCGICGASSLAELWGGLC